MVLRIPRTTLSRNPCKLCQNQRLSQSEWRGIKFVSTFKSSCSCLSDSRCRIYTNVQRINRVRLIELLIELISTRACISLYINPSTLTPLRHRNAFILVWSDLTSYLSRVPLGFNSPVQAIHESNLNTFEPTVWCGIHVLLNRGSLASLFYLTSMDAKVQLLSLIKSLFKHCTIEPC
jgi:hypothetical protein